MIRGSALSGTSLHCALSSASKRQVSPRSDIRRIWPCSSRHCVGAKAATVGSHFGFRNTWKLSLPASLLVSVRPQIVLPLPRTIAQSPTIWSSALARERAATRFCRMETPSLGRTPSKIPVSTSVKSSTASPLASCSRTISSPLMFHPLMSLVNGSAAAQPGSSSSFNPCGVESPFIVTTQVLLRSVVESSHWPIISFFSVAASCAHKGGVAASSASTATKKIDAQDFIGEPECALSTGFGRRLRDRGQRRLAGEPGLEIVDHELVHCVAGYHGS